MPQFKISSTTYPSANLTDSDGVPVGIDVQGDYGIEHVEVSLCYDPINRRWANTAPSIYGAMNDPGRFSAEAQESILADASAFADQNYPNG